MVFYLDEWMHTLLKGFLQWPGFEKCFAVWPTTLQNCAASILAAMGHIRILSPVFNSLQHPSFNGYGLSITPVPPLFLFDFL